RLRPALRYRLGAAGADADPGVVAGAQPRGAGLQPLPGARGRPVRPGADPDESLRGAVVRQDAGREPEHSPPRLVLQGLPLDPSERRRADRFLQYLSPLGSGPPGGRNRRSRGGLGLETGWVKSSSRGLYELNFSSWDLCDKVMESPSCSEKN